MPVFSASDIAAAAAAAVPNANFRTGPSKIHDRERNSGHVEAVLFVYQAALTELRNLPTSSLRRLLSPDSDCAAESTCDEADPVSLAPR